MSKPEDIPQDVWDAALSFIEAAPMVTVPVNGDAARIITINDPLTAVARAILAAKAEERNDCIRAAIDCQIDVPLTPGLPDGASIAKNAIVIAIRKRGEV